MKRFTYAMVMAVALIVMVSSFAVAGPDCKSEAKKVSMKECCIESAKAGKGCCGQDADAVKASYAGLQASCANKAACDAAAADMGKCCTAAMEAGTGCCGKDADALKASYEEKVAYEKASASVKADMHECCAVSLDAGKGCCGNSAEEMKADYDKKVEKEAKKVASS